MWLGHYVGPQKDRKNVLRDRHCKRGFDINNCQTGKGASNEEVSRGGELNSVQRTRHSSSRSRAGRPSTFDPSNILDEECAPYNCLTLERDVGIHEGTTARSSSPLAPRSFPKDLAMFAADRSEFHRRLQCLVSLNASAKLSRISEPSTIESVRKHSRQVYLIGRKNEKHKLGDVLWLHLQALIAGRPMKSLSEQQCSTREHDRYIMECREKQKVVLDEIRSFRFSESEGAEVGTQLTESACRDAMKMKLKTVQALLDKYEKFEALFPNQASMMKMISVDKVVKDRIALLYMWRNTTIDLYARIREVGVILGMHKEDSMTRRSSTLFSPNPASADSSAMSSCTLSWPTLDGIGDENGNETITRIRKASGASVLMVGSPQSTNIRTSTSSDLPALLGEPENLYTAFVSRSLRLKGMRRVLKRLESVCVTTVKKAVALLQRPPSSYAEAAGAARPYLHNRYMPLTADNYSSGALKDLGDQKFRSGEGVRYTVHHEQFIEMALPSFGNLFLFLVRVPLDLVHEWLKMRSSTQLSTDLLTLQTVIEDCHDCLKAAIAVKHQYIALVELAGLDSDTLLNTLAAFEDHLGDSYLNCVRDWAQMEARMEGDGAEWTEKVVQNLLSEWALAKRFAINVICGESEVAHRFCVIGIDLLRKMVNDFLSEKETVLEECRSEFETTPLGIESLQIPQLQRKQSQIFVACRHFKSLVGQLRDRSIRALTFARSVLIDIEICALYRIKAPQAHILLYQLYTTSHSLVSLPQLADRFVVFCNKSAKGNVDLVQLLLNITCSRNELELPPCFAKCDGYLLVFPVHAVGGYESWRGTRVEVNLDADTEMALRYLQVPCDAALIALNGASLPRMRNLLEKDLNTTKDGLLQVIEEQSSCHEIVLNHVERLKEEAVQTCRILWTHLAAGMADEVLDGRLLVSLDANELESVRATLLQAYNLAFEYHRELYRILPRLARCKFAEETVGWVKQWHTFVTSLVHRGDGTVPLWSVQSFQFLTLASDPQLTSHLPDDLYQDLVLTVDSCVKHIIGDSGMANGEFIDDEQSNAITARRSASVGYTQSQLDSLTRSQRIQLRVNNIDEMRDKQLEAENKIGHVTAEGRGALSLTTYFDPKKRAPFEWQRLEKKIGSGKFGTVYVVMNLTENCLMAMKQIRIERNHKALHALVDEVENLRSLDHPNLVKYYAVEVHREELMIFMEYCPEGTLESVCREGLLDVRCVRRYTHYLLKGVEYIHRKMIIHRDIKPANIFLGKKDVLKLGDFGSSVRLRGGTTACGEVAEWVGTPAYMAPEVQTLGGKIDVAGKEELVGYGRAADVWSVGCVVLEMCTGKPPWHECEAVLQIVFRVGSGMRPTIPQRIQADTECFSFLDMCFQTDPRKRATAEQLGQHPFANIMVGESVDSRISNFY
ncbi:Mitogen-activated protein kinase kinase kinase 4 [Toxocara canis]|uniref:Mitogen-activated protein kinase kinase kinase 4 n=1 Tax=Toxocara canis TaxID=6265 RepID=A0A0B2V9B1_TOXCA|nr:Mitogen-activated protein kinase kinase kinase 4 [Toxocara canis]